MGESESEVAQLCPTLCDPMDGSLPGSSIHGIFQARVLEWVAISFSRGTFLTQGSNPGLPHCRQTLYSLKHQGGLDSLLKSRNITLPAKFHLVKAMVFPVVKYGCESWTIKRKLSTEELMLWNCGVGEDS